MDHTLHLILYLKTNVLADLATVLAAPDKYKLISSIDLGDYKGNY